MPIIEISSDSDTSFNLDPIQKDITNQLISSGIDSGIKQEYSENNENDEKERKVRDFRTFSSDNKPDSTMSTIPEDFFDVEYSTVPETVNTIKV